MKVSCCCLVFLALLCLASGQTAKRFRATIFQNLANGARMEGTINYDESTNFGKQRIDWTTGFGSPSLSVYTVLQTVTMSVGTADLNVRSTVCSGSSCETETLPARPKFFKDTEHSQSITAWNGCQGWAIPGTTAANTYQVVRIWVNNQGLVCRATLADNTDYEFSNHAAMTQADSYFVAPSSICANPKCYAAADIMLVIDESDSISGSEWNQLMNLARSVVGMYSFNTDPGFPSGQLGARMGVVHFGSDYDLDTLDNYRSNVLNSLSWRYQSGSTRTDKAIKAASDHLFQNRRSNGKSPIPSFMIVFTDGYSDYPSTTLTQANAARSRNQTVLAVGVDGYNYNEMRDMVGGDLKKVFLVSSFSQLNSIFAELISQSCATLTRSACNCAGICGCKGGCICPTRCTSDPCLTPSCALATGACSTTPVVCTRTINGVPGTIDRCQSGTCVGGTCSYTDVICPASSNFCQPNVCQPAIGCTTVARNCDDQNICTTDRCNATTAKCDNILCPPKPCQDVACTPAGCVYTPKNCDDKNECTTDICVNDVCQNNQINCDDGNPCTVDTCAPSSGCVRSARDCNDNDPCTSDACIPSDPLGCPTNRAPVPCDKCKVGGGYKNCTQAPCKVSKCNPENGECEDTVYNSTTCIPTGNDKCILGFCNVTKGIGAGCEFYRRPCQPEACFDTFCNGTTGECEKKPRVCASNNKCLVGTCDPTTDSCVYDEVVCPNDLPCAVKRCEPTTGQCSIIEPIVCQNSSCQISFCDPLQGNSGACTFKRKCDDGKACTTDICSNDEACSYAPACDDSNLCTNDKCIEPPATINATIVVNVEVGFKSFVDVVKSFSLNPTQDLNGTTVYNATSTSAILASASAALGFGGLTFESGAKHSVYISFIFGPTSNVNLRETWRTALAGATFFGLTPKYISFAQYIVRASVPVPVCDFSETYNCTNATVCEKAVCDPLIGCTVIPRDCPAEITNLGNCHTVLCSLTERPNVLVVENGELVPRTAPPGCYVILNENAEQAGAKMDACGVCGGDGSTCGFGLSVAQAVGIGAGVLAAIIIGVVVGVALFGVGGKVGLDYYRKHRGNMGPAQSNPLYKENNLGGTNPMYND